MASGREFLNPPHAGMLRRLERGDIERQAVEALPMFAEMFLPGYVDRWEEKISMLHFR